MYCHKCGKQLFPNADYCSYCGTKIILHSEQDQDDSRREVQEEQHSSPVLDETHTTENKGVPEADNKGNENDDEEPTTFLGKVKNALYIIISIIFITIIQVIVRLMIHDKNTMRVFSYAVPGLLFGILMGIVSYIILIKWINIESKNWYIIVVLGISGVMGLIGGIPFAIGGSVISSIIIFIIVKK